MILDQKQKKEYRVFSILLCMLFTVIILSVWSAAGFAEEGVQAVNSSGNLNIKPFVDPFSKDAGFSVALYNNKNGMPTSEANAIAQTDDGFIWIGSYAGLIRYDGNNFERFGSDDGVVNVRCLYVDSKDRLWIGTNDAGFFLLSNGEFRHWGKSDGLDFLNIRFITEADDGNIYIAGTMGVGLVDESLQYSPIEDERLAGQTVSEIRHGGDGLVYGITNTGDLFTLKAGKLVFWLDSSASPVKGAIAVLPDPKHTGFLYVGTEHDVRYGNLEEGFNSWKTWDISPLLTIQSMEYIDGAIWLCTRTGLGKLENGVVHLLQNIPMNNSFVRIMTDRDGNLWVVSGRQGVMKIVPNRFTDLFDQLHLPEEVVNGTCMLDEQLFIGTENGLIVIEDGQRIDSLPLTKAVTANGRSVETSDLLEFLEGIRIRSIIRDSKNRLWISTARDRGLLRYDRGEITQFMKEDGLIAETVRVVSECEDGSILVATNDGFCVIEGDRIVKSYGEEEGIAVRLTLSIIEGFYHELIACSDGDGIYIISSDGLKRIGSDDGLTSEVVLRIRRSHTRDLYWIVTGNSLACMTPDYKVTTIREFPYENNYDIYENSHGDLWILGSTGIFVIPSEDLMEGESGEPVFFSIFDGLPYVDTANSYSELTQDGILYISGNEGVIKVDINKPFESSGEIRITVPYIDADGERYFLNQSGSFVLPGDTRKLTIFPYVLNYSLIDPQVSYRLEGFDSKTVTVRRSKLASVDYTNLKNGVYYFTITATDPVARSEQTVSFRIAKGKEMSVGTAGSIIIDVTSLFMMGGILIYTSLYRKRGRLEDRLFFWMILSNITLAVSDGVSYYLEGSAYPVAKEIMIIGNIVFYTMFAVFPYLYLLYLDYTAYQDKERLRKIKLPALIPCLLIFIILLINLKTGWIFSFSEDNMYHSGPLNNLVFIPAVIYVLLSFLRLYKINGRFIFFGILLIATRIVWGVWFRDISSTAFTYTLFLVCTHIYVLNKPMNEVAP